MTKKSNRFPRETRECAVRMGQEHRGEYASEWATIESIAPKIGCVLQTLHEWVRKQEVDTGLRDGITIVLLLSRPDNLLFRYRSLERRRLGFDPQVQGRLRHQVG